MDDKNTTPKLLRSGFLVKKGGAKEKSVLESWQKRWFTLKYKPLSETHEIEYFKNNTPNSNPLGLIVLSNKCSIAPSTRKECCLSLITPDREYFFCAKDHVEMEEWRKSISEAIHNSRNVDSTMIRSYSSSAFFTRTSTESISDEENANNNGTQNSPALHPHSPSQNHHTSNSNGSSSPATSHSNHSSVQQSHTTGENHSGSFIASSSSSSSSNGTSMSKRIAENKQIMEEYPFLLVGLDDLKWSDVPRLLEQYKRMALTTLMKEGKI